MNFKICLSWTVDGAFFFSFFFLNKENFSIFPENVSLCLYFLFVIFHVFYFLIQGTIHCLFSILVSEYVICHFNTFHFVLFFFPHTIALPFKDKIFMGKKIVTVWKENLTKITTGQRNSILPWSLETSQGQVWGEAKEFFLIVISSTSYLGWFNWQSFGFFSHNQYTCHFAWKPYHFCLVLFARVTDKNQALFYVIHLLLFFQCVEGLLMNLNLWITLKNKQKKVSLQDGVNSGAT